MDHLPDISAPRYSVPKIDYLGHRIRYDGKGFFDFPERQGWYIERHVRPLGPRPKGSNSVSAQDLEAFLQAWLFFGLIDEFFKCAGMDPNLDQFISDAFPGRHILTTMPLRSQLENLETARNSSHSGHETPGQVVEALKICINVLQISFETLVTREWLPHFDVNPDLLLCLVILGETLHSAMSVAWPHYSGPAETPGTRFSGIRPNSGPLSMILRNRFYTARYCPSEIEMIYNLFRNNYTALYLASQMDRPFSKKYIDHRNCSSSKCVAMDIDEDGYKPKHSFDCPDPSICQIMKIDVEAVVSKLKSGSIPLFTVSEHDGQVELRVSDSAENYIAVSHVWAHGRGNPVENGLPACQVRNIGRSAKAISSTTRVQEEIPIWMDTICIPVDRQHKPVRKKAIEKIDQTFREASQVIVLDADMELTPMPQSGIDLALRIVISGWMRRLWTLSEGVLSDTGHGTGKLNIRFSDGAMALNSIFRSSVHHTEQYKLSKSYSNRAISTVWRLLPSSSTLNLDSIKDVFSALEFRSTTREQDEPLCIASILGLDVAKILEHDSHEYRMRELYLMIHHLPADIIFHTRRRLSIQGFNWAPRSFLTGTTSIEQIVGRSKDQAAITDQGLMEGLSGYLITQKDQIPLEQIDPATFNYSYIAPDGEKRQWSITTPVDIAHPGVSYQQMLTRLVYQQRINMFIGNEPLLAVIISPNSTSEGVLVGVTHRGESLIHCWYFCRVMLWRRAPSALEKSKASRSLVAVESVPPTIQWCIG